MGEAGLARALRMFTWHETASATEALYTSVRRRPGGPHAGDALSDGRLRTVS
jgi:hypothetical protein